MKTTCSPSEPVVMHPISLSWVYRAAAAWPFNVNIPVVVLKDLERRGLVVRDRLSAARYGRTFAVPSHITRKGMDLVESMMGH